MRYVSWEWFWYVLTGFIMGSVSVYFVTRVIGKYYGTWLGGWMSGSTAVVRNYLGLALVPQAGVA